MISMRIGDRDYVKLVYHALVYADFNSMPSVAQALYRARNDGRVSAGNGGYDLFCRGLVVFNPKKADLQKLQINDQAKVIASVRDILSTEIFGGAKKKAPATGRGANGAQQANYRIEGL